MRPKRTDDTVLALFSGAGGLSLGFKRAGLAPALGVEIDRDARETYRVNIGSECLLRDLSDAESVNSIIAALGGVSRPPLLLLGGPPCQGFSTAGLRDAGDPRNRLIFSYLSVVDRLRPSWVLFENVEGLLTSNEGRSVRDFIRELIGIGYWVNVEKVNFAGFGLPQARKRVVIVGNRIGVDFEFPGPTHSFDGEKHRSANGLPKGPSVGEAIDGLGNTTAELSGISLYEEGQPHSDYDKLMRESNAEPGVRQHYAQRLSRADRERVKLLKPGDSMRDLPEALWPESYRSRAYRRVLDGVPTDRRGGAPAGLKRLHPNHASLTITSLSGRELIHPVQERPLSLRECARLQSFPDWFNFDGNFSSIARQIGNAFPPLASEVFARAILARHFSHKLAHQGGTPRLLRFHLTDSSGRSPALRSTETLLAELMGKRSAQQMLLVTAGEVNELGKLTVGQKTLITKARRADPVDISDREIARLVSVMLHDIGRDDLIPTFIGAVPDGYSGYYHLPLAWFRQDEQRPFDLASFFVACTEEVGNFETIFTCLCEVHKRRRKYDAILRGQPRPIMDQVARRGLLEFGIVKSPALTSWLVWRKWLYDIDNRSAQETGYLFEPVLAHALGGVPCGQRQSPIKRLNREGRRQVDCLIEADNERRAYEFKVRFTIASSGQGRFAEELSFPKEAVAAGFVPVLIVLDPTENEKLAALRVAFIQNGGEVYVGEAAWGHIAERAGPTMSAFVRKYVREPIESIVKDDEPAALADISLSWDMRNEKIVIKVGEQSWEIDRGEESEVEMEGEDSEDSV